MGPNVLLALQMAAQAIQLTQQIQVMLQNSAARGTDLTDEELNTLRDGYNGVRNNVEKFLAEHAGKQAADAGAGPADEAAVEEAGQ